MNNSIPTPEQQHQQHAIVLDTPKQIEGYRLLATLTGLRMEIRTQQRGWPPTGCPTRGRALGSARRIAAEYEWPSVPRTRKQALIAMEEICVAVGLIEGGSHESDHNNHR